MYFIIFSTDKYFKCIKVDNIHWENLLKRDLSKIKNSWFQAFVKEWTIVEGLFIIGISKDEYY